MTSKGSTYGQFRRALDAGQAVNAYALATELRNVTLPDALDLCFVLAATQDWRFEKAAKRWLQRFTTEAHPSLPMVLMAGAALSELGRSPCSEVARETLKRMLE